MNIKPFSLIDDDESSSQTHFSSKNKKHSKDEGDNNSINNKKPIISGNNIINADTAKKGNDLKNMEINNQQKVVINFREKINKEMSRGKLFQIDLKNKILSQNKNNNNTKNDISIPTKEEKDKQDIANMIKNEEKTDNKLSKNLLNDKKQRRNSYHGKIYFYIAVSMLLYQYLSYVYLIEIPIIQSKYNCIYNYQFIYILYRP